MQGNVFLLSFLGANASPKVITAWTLRLEIRKELYLRDLRQRNAKSLFRKRRPAFLMAEVCFVVRHDIGMATALLFSCPLLLLLPCLTSGGIEKSPIYVAKKDSKKTETLVREWSQEKPPVV